jgi:predicted PhzF superfamily epimerase YddE/YHI9
MQPYSLLQLPHCIPSRKQNGSRLKVLISSFIPVRIPSLESMAQLRAAKPPSVAHVLDADFEGAVGGVMYYYELPTLAGGDGTRKFRVRRMTSGGEEDPATGSAACAFGVWMSQNAMKSKGTAKRASYRYAIDQGVEMGRVSGGSLPNVQ